MMLNGPRNALSEIKRLLTVRDPLIQNKACCYLIEVINRYNRNTIERNKMIEYLVENDVVIFLCEAISNLDFNLLRSVTSCFRLLWCNSTFFTEEHSTHTMTAILRSLVHYTNSSAMNAVECCLHFLCDLINGITANEAPSPLSRQNAYSAEQLLSCYTSIAPKIASKQSIILSSALVLQALISYQPVSLNIRGETVRLLAEVLKEWFGFLLTVLNQNSLMGGERNVVGMFYTVICQLGIDSARLLVNLQQGKRKDDFIDNILIDEQDLAVIQQYGVELGNSLHMLIGELVKYTKTNLESIESDEYEVFLRFLLSYLDNKGAKTTELCDVLYTSGYLKILPEIQLTRNDAKLNKLSTILLGEILKVLTQTYLSFDEDNEIQYPKEIDMGLAPLQNNIEISLASNNRNDKFYSMLIYSYFYCQSCDNPQDTSAPLLSYLVGQLLKLPKGYRMPKYAVKALWLVFSMSTISNDYTNTLDQRLCLERATDVLVGLLLPSPTIYYTHHPAILLWSFTSHRIAHSVRVDVLSKWLEHEDSLPEELSTERIVWELLLKVLLQNTTQLVLFNALKAISICMENVENVERQEFSMMLWSVLPNILSKVLIDPDCGKVSNLSYILELSSNLVPSDIDHILCLKVAALIATLFSKHNSTFTEENYHFEYVCMKLSLYLLGMSNVMEDCRVLMTYMNRSGFLTNVLNCSSSTNSRVACASLQLLSYIVHYFTKGRFQPKSVLEVPTTSIVKSLKTDSSIERSASLVQLCYIILNSGTNTPLVLSDRLAITSEDQQGGALRALMFRVQMLCCKESTNQSSAGWKTLSSIFKYSIVTKNDSKLVANLTMQPWTLTLIHYQLTQTITNEFLSFLSNWLSLYQITMKNNIHHAKIGLLRYSSIFKILHLLKTNLRVDENDDYFEVKKKILVCANELLTI